MQVDGVGLNKSHGVVLWSAAFILAIAMGFGRFSYTAIYPYSLAEGIFSTQEGGFLAAVNYAGYLLGAIFAIRIAPGHARHVCGYAIVGTIFCLAMSAMADSILTLLWLRGLAGVCSALAMVAASVWLLQQSQQRQFTAFLYAGVGIGIVLSAELIVLGSYWQLTSQGLWLLLAIAALLLGSLAYYGLKHTALTQATFVSSLSDRKVQNVQVWALIVIYGLAGFGYIITATYLPVLMDMMFHDVAPAHIWALFGLGAIPSCFLWQKLSQYFAIHLSLAINLALQALGVILPVYLSSPIGYALSALLVGGTFMGTVTLAMQMAQRMSTQVSYHLIAIMTIVYGLGQILGPMLTNLLYTFTHDFHVALIIAALALLTAALISLKSLSLDSKRA